MEGINLIRMVGSSCVAHKWEHMSLTPASSRVSTFSIPNIYSSGRPNYGDPLENGMRNLETQLMIGC